MRYTYNEVFRAIDNANKLLGITNKNEKLIVKDNYKFLSIYSVNVNTMRESIMVENVTRDEGYYWLEGFNTALMNNEFSSNAPVSAVEKFLLKFKKVFS